MRGVVVHSGLLLAALVASFLTWTGDRPTTLERERTVVWNRDTTEVLAVEYRSESHDVDITRRELEAGEFLWGVETRRVEGVASGATTLEFPAGAPAADILKGFAALGVIRDLGPLADADAPRFGLGEPSATLAVLFEDERRELQLGNETPGGSDRYGHDVAAGRAYVIPGELISPLESGTGALRERRVHYFPPDDVWSVRVEANGNSRLMVRGGEEDSRGSTWTSPDAPDRPDQTFANFMERVGQLAIEGFRDQTELPLLTRRLRVDYFDEDGESLGFVELHRSAAGPADDPRDAEYFLLSERMPVPADAIRSLAERVDTDLGDLF